MSSYSDLITIKPTEQELNLPMMSGRSNQDVQVLSTLSKKELLALCENDAYVFDLCNKTPILYHIITSPSMNF
jgi:hypothetical protein